MADIDAIWKKALKDEAYRKQLMANPAVELKKAGVADVPGDLKMSIVGGKLTFKTADQMALKQLNSRVTKSK